MVSHLYTSIEQPTKPPKKGSSWAEILDHDIGYFNRVVQQHKLETDADIAQLIRENVYPAGRSVFFSDGKFVLGRYPIPRLPGKSYPKMSQPVLANALRIALDWSWGYNQPGSDLDNMFRFFNVFRRVFVVDRVVVVDQEARTVDFTALVDLAQNFAGEAPDQSYPKEWGLQPADLRVSEYIGASQNEHIASYYSASIVRPADCIRYTDKATNLNWGKFFFRHCQRNPSVKSSHLAWTFAFVNLRAIAKLELGKLWGLTQAVNATEDFMRVVRGNGKRPFVPLPGDRPQECRLSLDLLACDDTSAAWRVRGSLPVFCGAFSVRVRTPDRRQVTMDYRVHVGQKPGVVSKLPE